MSEPTADLEVRTAADRLISELASHVSGLQRSRDLSEVKNIRDVAAAAKRYAQAKKLGAEAERYAAEIVLRAERRIGELLTETPKKSGGDRSKNSGTEDLLSTPRQKVGYKTSMRSQQLAAVPEPVFEDYLSSAKQPSAPKLLRTARDRQAAESPPLVPRVTAAGDIRIEHCGIAEFAVAADSADLIFTDPPYHREHLGLWDDLGAFAAKALKPGCLLVTYSGQMFLHQAMNRLARHLDYWWCYAIVHDGAFFQHYSRRVQCGWKPLLVFAKPGGEPPSWTADIVNSGHREKTGHDWQQAAAEAAYWIGKLTSPGDLVADPFLGSGTTAAVCKQLGRAMAGCDIDPAAVKTARERVA